MAGSSSTLTHSKCISGVYPGSAVERFSVPKDKISWKSDFPSYSPEDYTSPTVKGQIWADEEEKAIIKRAEQPGQVMWNEMDSVCKINRKSYLQKYEIDKGLPRWKRDADGKKTNILQFIAIRRRDTDEWAIPGGMVDAGEKVSQTVRREFGEEAFNTLKMEPNKKKELEQKLKEFFRRGVEIYSGYVDDPRNTDNAWMETVAFHFHDEDGDIVGQFELNAGDDAVGVKWLDISHDIKLYASHLHMIKQVVDRLKAHW